MLFTRVHTARRYLLNMIVRHFAHERFWVYLVLFQVSFTFHVIIMNNDNTYHHIVIIILTSILAV